MLGIKEKKYIVFSANHRLSPVIMMSSIAWWTVPLSFALFLHLPTLIQKRGVGNMWYHFWIKVAVFVAIMSAAWYVVNGIGNDMQRRRLERLD